MKEFIAVRSAGESMIRESGINATFDRLGMCSAGASLALRNPADLLVLEKIPGD